MKTFNPKDLDLKKLFEEDPPPFKCDVDEIRYLLGTLIKLKAQHKDLLDEEYTPMMATLMQARVRTYNKQMDWLVKKGVLIKNKFKYKVGEKSQSYKVAPEYMKNGFKTVEIKKKSLLKIRPKEQVKLDDLREQYGYLVRWFNPKLKINYDQAYGWIMNTAFVETKAGVVGALEKAHYRLAAVEMLRDGTYNLSVDDTVKRFWSNLGNLKKELRQFITYDGKRLVAIDIKNSQPFFSMVFFNPDFYAKSKDGFTLYSLSEDIYGRIEPKIPTIQSILINSPFFMLVKSNEEEAGNDLERYCTLVDKGRLYNYISDQYHAATGTRYDVNVPAEKEKLKVSVFYTMYSHNSGFAQEDGHGEMKKLFIALFPTVYKLFSLLKKAAHNDLAIILQLIESEIVVRKTASSISMARPAKETERRAMWLSLFTLFASETLAHVRTK